MNSMCSVQNSAIVDASTAGSRLGAMIRRYFWSLSPSIRYTGFAALVLVAQSCDRPQPAPPIDSTTVSVTPVPPAPEVVDDSGWDAVLGPMLLIAGASPQRATAIFPPAGDTVAVAGTTLELLGRDGQMHSATLGGRAEPDPDGCGALPTWDVAAAEGLHPWTVGFIRGTAEPTEWRPIPMDSLESFSRSDSARVTAQLARLASRLRDDSAGRFVGLPFSVQSLWRFSLANGKQFIAANMIRRVNQEAQPLEERTLIIAEGDSSSRELSAVYSERSHGSEETNESREVLLAVYAPDGSPTLVIGRDYGNAVAYSLLEWDASGTWHLRWTSRRVVC